MSGASRARLLVVFLLAVAVAGAVVAAADWGEIRGVLARAEWRWLWAALGATAISHAALGFGFALVAALFDLPVSRRFLALTAFASYAVNHLFGFAGVVGYSIRLAALKRRGIPVADVLAPSLIHSYLNNLAILVLVPVGLAALLTLRPMEGAGRAALWTAVGALILAALAAFFLLVHRGFRRRALGWVGAACRAVLRREPPASLAALDRGLTRGTEAARTHPGGFAIPVALVAVDWLASTAALGFCFAALGHPVGPGTLLTGFAIGMAAGQLSMVPGGLGVQEGSMAGIYALLGVPFDTALLASILFRAVYYFAPYLVSLALYWRLFRAPEP